MFFFDKTLSAIVDVELAGHSGDSQSEKNLSTTYISNALLLMPWFFRYPISMMVVFMNLLALFSKRSMYYKLTVSDRSMLWYKIAHYPGFSSLNRLIRTLTLLSAYSIHHDQRN